MDAIHKLNGVAIQFDQQLLMLARESTMYKYKSIAELRLGARGISKTYNKIITTQQLAGEVSGHAENQNGEDVITTLTKTTVQNKTNN